MNAKYHQYTTISYAGRRLLENHSLSETGHWQIYGEDPNADFGGTHHEPELGIVSGKLDDVIKYAVDLPKFWTWGGGGRIVKVEIKSVVDARVSQLRVAEIDAQVEKLLAEKKKLLGA